MESLHYWNACDGSQVFGLRCGSFKEGEDSLPYWKWRREIPGDVERVVIVPITENNQTEKQLENVNTSV